MKRRSVTSKPATEEQRNAPRVVRRGIAAAAASLALLGSGCESPSAQRAAADEAVAIAAMREGKHGFDVIDMNFKLNPGARIHTTPSFDLQGERGDDSQNIAFTVGKEGLEVSLPFVYESINGDIFYGVMDPRTPEAQGTAHMGDHSSLVWFSDDLLGQENPQGGSYLDITAGTGEHMLGAILGAGGYELNNGPVAIAIPQRTTA